jgi:hypothetical protein
MVFAAAPATASVAAYPTSSFQLKVGASYFNGTVTWYNRSINATGPFKATGCRRVYVQPWAGTTPFKPHSSSLWCDTAGTATLPADTDQPGGADHAQVYMTDSVGKVLAEQTCYRTSSVCS